MSRRAHVRIRRDAKTLSPNDGRASLTRGASTIYVNQPPPHLSAVARIRLNAYLKLPTARNENNTYDYPVLVTCERKFYPVFPGSISMESNLHPRLKAAIKFQQPILGTALWGKRSLLEMYEAMKEVLESGYRCDLYDTIPNIEGFNEEVTDKITLNDVCAKYFEPVNGDVKPGPLILAFKPRPADQGEDDEWASG